MLKCGKCGSTNNYSRCFLGDDFFVYDYGCEDCEHFVSSEPNADYSKAMDEAIALFAKNVSA